VDAKARKLSSSKKHLHPVHEPLQSEAESLLMIRPEIIDFQADFALKSQIGSHPKCPVRRPQKCAQ
jgi:hypothetical protein